MKQRIQLKNATHLVQFPDTVAGAMQAIAFRRNNKEFKGRRLERIIQMDPDSVEMGTIYPIV